MIDANTTLVCCNGAPGIGTQPVQALEYRRDRPGQNVTVGLPAFVMDVLHIPPRVLDLLEIAAYVFASDRLTSRGRNDLLEYSAWSRRFRMRIRVRDAAFWSQPHVSQALTEALKFMTGDAAFEFDFLSGHSTPPTSLFDIEGTTWRPAAGDTVFVTLFSGGLDSLAGAIQALANRGTRVVLVSHQSQTGTKRTQRQLVEALRTQFGADRVVHYEFQCHLKGERAPEETQRTRFFLYAAIGFAIANAHGAHQLAVYENGVTSLNLRRREDLSNARASRTTHPMTARLMGRVLSLVADRAFGITLPLLWNTKTDVVRSIHASGNANLIASTVTCSRTYQRSGDATHCGRCFQCVDRRMAVHAAGLEAYDDAGLYSQDIITSDIEDPEGRTTLVDYIRQATRLAQGNSDSFDLEYMSELPSILDGIGASDELDALAQVWALMNRHGDEVGVAIRRMRELYDDPYTRLNQRSLLGLIAQREHLKPQVARAVESIAKIVMQGVPEMFKDHRPKDEPDLNRKIGALLRTHEAKLKSEHPTVPFACARVVPDHELTQYGLLIESKYVRKNTSPSKATEGIAADLTKYPSETHILFLVYDPDAAIVTDEFRRDIEAKGRCTVRVVR